MRSVIPKVNAYESFARVYDRFMTDAPYEPWFDLIQDLVELEGVDIADLGCGTGQLTVQLGLHARTCVGVDMSMDMLTQAQEWASENRVRVEWLCQDLASLRLPRSVDLAVSTCDVMNYVTSLDTLTSVFAAVYEALKPNGLFAFDVIGPSRLERLAHGYWHQVEEDAVLLHETRVDGTKLEHDVHAFVQTYNEMYERIEEHHEQTYYSPDQLIHALESTGFTVREPMADFDATHSVTHADRIILIAEKK